MKKVVLLGFIGSNNLGDEAINFSIIQKFANSKHFLTLISFDVMATNALAKKSGISNFEVFSVHNYLNIIKSIKSCDLFVCGGGGIIQDQTSIYNLIFFLLFIKVAQFFHKKVMLYAVGVGPLISLVLRSCVKQILGKVEMITVRDQSSKDLLINLGIPQKTIHVTADPAITLKTSQTYDLNLSSNTITIFVCLRHWFYSNRFVPVKMAHWMNNLLKIKNAQYTNFVQEIAKTLDCVIEKFNTQIFFFPFWTGRDTLVHQDVIRYLKNKDKTKLWTDKVDPETALAMFKNADIVLGMRLHSLIYATNLLKKCIAISYSSKVEIFFSSIIDNPFLNQLMLNPSRMNSDELISAFEILIKEDSYHGLKNKVELMKQLEEDNFLLLEELLKT